MNYERLTHYLRAINIITDSGEALSTEETRNFYNIIGLCHNEISKGRASFFHDLQSRYDVGLDPDWQAQDVLDGMQELSSFFFPDVHFMLSKGDPSWRDDTFNAYLDLLSQCESVLKDVKRHFPYMLKDESEKTPIINARVVKNKKKGGRVKSAPFIGWLNGSPEEKQRLVEKFHELCDGKSGKAFAMVIRAGHKARVLSIPPVSILIEEFTDKIGSPQNVSKYLGLNKEFKGRDLETFESLVEEIESVLER